MAKLTSEFKCGYCEQVVTIGKSIRYPDGDVMPRIPKACLHCALAIETFMHLTETEEGNALLDEVYDITEPNTCKDCGECCAPTETLCVECRDNDWFKQVHAGEVECVDCDGDPDCYVCIFNPCAKCKECKAKRKKAKGKK